MLIQLIVTCAILIFFLIAIVVFIIHFIQEVTSNAPFVPISNEVLDEIIKIMNIKDGSVVYELGSGDGKVVFGIAKKFPNAQVVGVERSLLPFMISSVKKYFNKVNNSCIINSNFLNVSVAPATHVYLYLFPSIMKKLLPKFEKELAPGTRVFSCDFKLDERNPVEVVDLQRKKHGLGNKIYIYEF